MISTHDSGSSDLGLSHSQGHYCVVFLGENVMLAVTLRWTSIPSREGRSRNTSGRFTPQKLG